MCKSWLHIWKSIDNIYHICQNFISESKRQMTSHRTCIWWGMFCICVHLHVLHMCSFICPTYVSVYMSCLCLHLHVLHMSLFTSCSDERCCVLYVSPFTCSGGICCVLYLSPFTYPAYVSVYISCICLCSHVVMDGAVSCTCLCSHVVMKGAGSHTCLHLHVVMEGSVRAAGPSVVPPCHDTDLYGRKCPLVPSWHDHFVSNPPLSDWI